jgi:ribosomal protein S12 methylthiotransferase
VAIRTTCIVGFPGETDADFEQLTEFLLETEFERVGVFTYSPQEGTRAAEMDDDVPEELKRERLERVQELQRHITAGRYESRLGARARVLVQESAAGEHPASGRLPWQADDIDGLTWLDRDVPAGRFADVEVLEVVDDYDFNARVISVDAEPVRPATAGRALPVMSSSVGSFGR